MNNQIFDYFEWKAPTIFSPDELRKTLVGLDIMGKCIKELWTKGIAYNEEHRDNMPFIELDEPIIFIVDNMHLEILAADGGVFRVAKNTLTLEEHSYQGPRCSRRYESIFSEILHKRITGFEVLTSEEVDFTGAFGLELPEQEEYIKELVLFFENQLELHIGPWYDFMHVYIEGVNHCK